MELLAGKDLRTNAYAKLKDADVITQVISEMRISLQTKSIETAHLQKEIDALANKLLNIKEEELQPFNMRSNTNSPSGFSRHSGNRSVSATPKSNHSYQSFATGGISTPIRSNHRGEYVHSTGKSQRSESARAAFS